MKHTSALILISAIVLSACANPDRFGAGGSDSISNPSDNIVTTPSVGPDPATPQYFSQIIGDRVQFVVDSSELTAQSRMVLDSQAVWLLANTDFNAIIEGHADEQGTREYNVALGARRANAVREYLISKAVPASRLRTLSYGKERPIAVCSEENCYSRNRRAVTIISASLLS